MSASAALAEEFGHGQCLLCGHANPLSLRLNFTPEEDGSVVTHIQGHQHLQGYDTLLHGGVLASLLDCAMTHCLFHQGIKAVTGDLHVRYVHPVPCTATLELRARLLARKGPIYRMRAEILCEDEIAVWAEAKFMPQRG